MAPPAAHSALVSHAELGSAHRRYEHVVALRRSDRRPGSASLCLQPGRAPRARRKRWTGSDSAAASAAGRAVVANSGGVLIREREAPAEPFAKARQEPRPPKLGHYPNSSGLAALIYPRRLAQDFLLDEVVCAQGWKGRQEPNGVIQEWIQ